MLYLIEFVNENTGKWQKYLTKTEDKAATKLAKDLHDTTGLRTRVRVLTKDGKPG